MRAFDASTSLGCPKGTMLCACTGGGGGGVACLSVDHNRESSCRVNQNKIVVANIDKAASAFMIRCAHTAQSHFLSFVAKAALRCAQGMARMPMTKRVLEEIKPDEETCSNSANKNAKYIMTISMIGKLELNP